MHWELSEEQELFTTSLREWLGERANSTTVRSCWEAGDSTGFENIFVSEGWAGVGFDDDLGGQGGGLLELALTARELGRAAAPSTSWLQSAIILPALAGEPALVRAAIESGEVTALAVRADQIPSATTSVRIAADRLHGRIPCVLGAGRSQRLLVPVQDGHTTSLWLVDSTDGGVQLRPRPLLDRSRDVADVVLDDVTARRLDIGPDAALGEIAARAAVLTAADALGACERMLQLAVEYSKQRQQFGHPIGSFQAVKHAAAQMLVTVESSMSIVYYAAQSTEEGQPEHATHAAVAKAQVTEHGAELADSALTLHGAIGYTWEHDLHLFYKRAKLDRVLFGTPASWNECIAQNLPLLPAPA
ncbi:acyl-CoA dehydrogenase family protein [[Mycobacterium] zoologicum]|uniref:acyl-CoA dehydrogenase family protein n=1 Tax=[Mycobacterium] zoologicum TaxID=2872311 RepID=UPI001CDA597F|nr:acyl-CoA dehydrogenase family protein [Mycolicibacter sp. MYC101]MEB3061989.1 acyl-CoA dehydrogenase family protein [Mycolicibacter sp. MYC101]